MIQIIRNHSGYADADADADADDDDDECVVVVVVVVVIIMIILTATIKNGNWNKISQQINEENQTRLFPSFLLSASFINTSPNRLQYHDKTSVKN